ncbi:DoxX family protein, partial [Streptomyces sp. NPDC054838]
DLSALGGLLIAAADTHGKPSLVYRSRHVLDHRHPVRAVQRPVGAAAARSAARVKAVARGGA